MGWWGDDLGREQGDAGSGQGGCAPIPQPSPRENRPSIPHFSSLPSSLAPGPSSFQQLPAGPGPSFISCPLSPPRREEKSLAGAGTALRPPPPASRGQRQGRHCPRRCHVASGCCCHSPAQAVLEQSGAWCRADAGGGQAVLQGRDGHSRSKLPRHGRAGGVAKDTAWTKALQDCGVTSNSVIPAQGPTGATTALSATLQPKRRCLPSHTGVLELSALWGVTPKAGLFCCAHGRSQAKLGPTAAPQCPVP